jgi:hypothetical protein
LTSAKPSGFSDDDAAAIAGARPSMGPHQTAAAGGRRLRSLSDIVLTTKVSAHVTTRP